MEVSCSRLMAIVTILGMLLGSSLAQAPGFAQSAALTVSPPRSSPPPATPAPSPTSTRAASAPSPSPVSVPPASSPSPSVLTPPSPAPASPTPATSPSPSYVSNPSSESRASSPPADGAAFPSLNRCAVVLASSLMSEWRVRRTIAGCECHLCGFTCLDWVFIFRSLQRHGGRYKSSERAL